MLKNLFKYTNHSYNKRAVASMIFELYFTDDEDFFVLFCAPHVDKCARKKDKDRPLLQLP